MQIAESQGGVEIESRRKLWLSSMLAKAAMSIALLAGGTAAAAHYSYALSTTSQPTSFEALSNDPMLSPEEAEAIADADPQLRKELLDNPKEAASVGLERCNYPFEKQQPPATVHTDSRSITVTGRIVPFHLVTNDECAGVGKY